MLLLILWRVPKCAVSEYQLSIAREYWKAVIQRYCGISGGLHGNYLLRQMYLTGESDGG